MMPRALLVTTNFWPEPTGTGPYAADLTTTLNLAGYEVEVLTGVPHYPWWKISSAYLSDPERWSNFNGIKVIRASHFVPKIMTLCARIRFELSLIKSFRRAVSKMRLSNYDLVIAIGSSLAGGLVARSISANMQVPLGVVAHDLAGLGTIQSGLSARFLIAKLVMRIERSIFLSAKNIVAISQAMTDAIVKMGVQESKVTTILIHSASRITPYNRDVARARLGWKSKDFIVLHTGNMGAKQDLENVIRASELLKDGSTIRIFLVGHGNQELKIRNLCLGKSNISVYPAVSNEDYPTLLAAADLLLVNERRTQMEMSLPSKLTSYLFSERPVIAAVPRNGASWKFLDGVADLVEAGEPLALARAIESLSENPERLQNLAKQGKFFADTNLNPEIARKKYLEWVKGLLNPE